MYYIYYYGSDYRLSNPADPECNSNIIAQKRTEKLNSKKSSAPTITAPATGQQPRSPRM